MFYKIQKTFMAIFHFTLLYWIYYVLTESGQMHFLEVLYHFSGLSFYGATIIIATALWDKHHHIKKIKTKRYKRSSL